MNILTDLDERKEAARRLAEILDARVEWLCADPREGLSVSLGRGEWELEIRHHALYFSYRTKRGAMRVWRVAGWEWTGDRLRLDATRRMGAERAGLELIPRAPVRDGIETLKAARRAACEKLAALVCTATGNATVERATLSAGARRSEPGRYARIILRVGRERIAVTGAVVAARAHEGDAFLASALLWWKRGGGGSNRTCARRLWLVVSHAAKDATAERLSLLREEVRREISLFETNEGGHGFETDESGHNFETDEGGHGAAQIALPSLEQTFARAARFRRPPRAELSETARDSVEAGVSV